MRHMLEKVLTVLGALFIIYGIGVIGLLAAFAIRFHYESESDYPDCVDKDQHS